MIDLGIQTDDLEGLGAVGGLVEQQFGERAYPTRIRMAELPGGCALIPNPYNRIPGFSIGAHHFFPGFPEMAWPMLDWVLDTCYAEHYEASVEYSVVVQGVTESELCDLMDALVDRHRQVRLFSLPRLRPERSVELGFRGQARAARCAFDELRRELAARGLAAEVVSGD